MRYSDRPRRLRFAGYSVGGSLITIFAPVFDLVLGADHPDTLKGRMAEAIPLYRGALADCERVRGTDHPDTNAARGALAALTVEPKRHRRINRHKRV